MARSKSSGQWLKEHFDDPYVLRAQKDGWRSRAAYKLLEIQEKDALIKPGMTIVDLGSAPGGWSQVAMKLVGHHGMVIASDILPMDPIAGVDFIQGDFTELDVYQQIIDQLQGRQVDLVISDMAPNMSGMRSVDQPKAMYLVELALDMAANVLKPQGHLLVKAFQGEGIEAYRAALLQHFKRVVTRKPAASRPRSREVYLLAQEFQAK